jgi:hypothetical protein
MPTYAPPTPSTGPRYDTPLTDDLSGDPPSNYQSQLNQSYSNHYHMLAASLETNGKLQ